MQKKEEMFVYSESLFYICRHIKYLRLWKIYMADFIAFIIFTLRMSVKSGFHAMIQANKCIGR